MRLLYREQRTYWNKVRKKPNEVIAGELNYISDFLETKSEVARSNLLIAKTPIFGMFQRT